MVFADEAPRPLCTSFMFLCWALQYTKKVYVSAMHIGKCTGSKMTAGRRTLLGALGLTALFHDIGYPLSYPEQVKSYFGGTIERVPYVLSGIDIFISLMNR